MKLYFKADDNRKYPSDLDYGNLERSHATGIRIPGWATPASVRITVDGDDTPVERVGPVAQISGDTLSPPGTVMMTYALPERRSSETTPVGDVYELLWRGDEIAGINPNEGPRLFYPDLT
mgnify:CR=1 FL=1